MYKGQVIGLISDQNIKIWRYMEYKRFKEMLLKKKLYFSRVDRFDDKFEGWVPGDDILRHALFEKYRTQTYANCWHGKDYESNLMWEKYSNGKGIWGKYSNGKGIVIQSTFKRLVESLRLDSNEEYIDKVKYIDSNINLEIENNIRIPFFIKRQEYDDEREIRAIIQIMNPSSWNMNDMKGVEVPILINELIENIYVYSQAKNNFFNSVQDIVKKSGLNINVKESFLCKNRTGISGEARSVNIIMIQNYGADVSGNWVFSQTTPTVIVNDQKYQQSLNQNKERFWIRLINYFYKYIFKK